MKQINSAQPDSMNLYFRTLEQIRKSGKINMFGAAPYLMSAFNLPRKEAMSVLVAWMESYNNG